jgi:hypothetical protein
MRFQVEGFKKYLTQPIQTNRRRLAALGALAISGGVLPSCTNPITGEVESPKFGPVEFTSNNPPPAKPAPTAAATPVAQPQPVARANEQLANSTANVRPTYPQSQQTYPNSAPVSGNNIAANSPEMLNGANTPIKSAMRRSSPSDRNNITSAYQNPIESDTKTPCRVPQSSTVPREVLMPATQTKTGSFTSLVSQNKQWALPFLQSIYTVTDSRWQIIPGTSFGRENTEAVTAPAQDPQKPYYVISPNGLSLGVEARFKCSSFPIQTSHGLVSLTQFKIREIGDEVHVGGDYSFTAN